MKALGKRNCFSYFISFCGQNHYSFVKENDAIFTTIKLNEREEKGTGKNILLKVKQSYSNLFFTDNSSL